MFWYKQTFSNGDVSYFAETERCKNDNLKGFSVFVDLMAPRRKPKAKHDTIPTAFLNLWQTISPADVPDKVLKAVRDRVEGV